MKIFGKNKKANAIVEPVIVLVILITFAIISVMSYILLQDFKDTFDSDPDMANESVVLVDDYATRHPQIYDSAIGFLLVMSWIATILFGLIIDAHPAFFVISLFALIFIVIAAAEIGNFYVENFQSDADLQTFTAEFPVTNWIMNHIVALIVGIFVTAAISTYSKFRG